jgi:hypothetical protein
MTAITPSRQLIQLEETRFRAAVSEATAQKIGGSVNFFLQQIYQQKEYFINGNYSSLSTPFSGIDGLQMFFNNATLTDAFLYIKTAGSSGNTSLDIKFATTPGGSFTSIFTTPPSINYQAGNYAWCRVGTSYANTTAPVFNSAATAMSAGSVIRCDVLSVQGGSPLACGIIIKHNPA